jgi:hypothetical protein
LIGFAIGRILPPQIHSSTLDILPHLIIFFFVFEFIIYQARYLFNDVRDRYVDCAPNLSKRRFPCSLKDDRSALTATFISFIIRCAIALLIVGCILPVENGRWMWHLGFLISIFLIAMPYETIRSRCLTAAKAGSRSRTTMWTMVLIGVAGLSYSLRSVVGLWLAEIDDRVALTLAALGASLLGSTLVALFWALESTRAGIDDLSAAKAHLVLFRSIVSKTGSNVGPRERVLAGRLAGRQFFTAPWCITAVLATSILATFALYLLQDYFSGVVFSLRFGRIGISLTKPVLVAVTVAAIEGLLTILALVKPVDPVKHRITLIGFIFIALVITLHWSSVPLSQSIVAAVLSTLPLIMSYALRTMCFNDLPGFTDRLISMVRGRIESLYKWFIRPR